MQPPLPPAGAVRPLSAAFLSLFCAHFIIDLNTGVFPMYKAKIGLDIAESAVWATIAGVVASLCQPLFGMMADRRSGKIWIACGVFLTATATFALSLTFNVTLLCILLIAQQMGSAAFHPAGAAQAGRMASSTKRGTIIALFTTLGTIGFAGSHFLTSLSYDFTSGTLGWNHAFLLPILIPSLLVFLAILLTPLPSSSEESSTTDFRQIRAALAQHRRPLFVFFALNIVIAGISIIHFALPELLKHRGYPPMVYEGGAYFAFVIGSAVAMFPGGALADRFGKRRICMIGLLAAIPTYALFALVEHMPTAGLLSVIFLIGAFTGMISPLVIAGAHEFMPARNLGLASGIVMGAAWSVAASLRIPLGYMIEGYGFTMAYTAFGSLLLVGLAVAFFVPAENTNGLARRV